MKNDEKLTVSKRKTNTYAYSEKISPIRSSAPKTNSLTTGCPPLTGRTPFPRFFLFAGDRRHTATAEIISVTPYRSSKPHKSFRPGSCSSSYHIFAAEPMTKKSRKSSAPNDSKDRTVRSAAQKNDGRSSFRFSLPCFLLIDFLRRQPSFPFGIPRPFRTDKRPARFSPASP